MENACPLMAREAVEQLQAKGLDPALDHIAELIEYAARIERPGDRVFPYLSHHGIKAGPHRFRPLTIKADLWFDWVLEEIESETLHTYAFAYASEFGHLPETDFVAIRDLSACARTLSDYAAGLTCTDDELREALNRIMVEPTDGDKIRAANSEDCAHLEDTIAQLVAVTGQPAEYWHCQTLDFAMRVLQHALTNAAGVFGLDTGPATSFEYQRANFDFFACFERIERELQEVHATNG